MRSGMSDHVEFICLMVSLLFWVGPRAPALLCSTKKWWSVCGNYVGVEGGGGRIEFGIARTF